MKVTPKKPIDLSCFERYVRDPSVIKSIEDQYPTKMQVNGTTTSPTGAAYKQEVK